jgi:hypothetical protein
MRLYVYSGKFILAAMYFRRVGIDERIYAAAPTQVSTVATPPAPAGKKLGVGLLITALAQLYVRNLARRFDSRPTATFFPMAGPD